VVADENGQANTNNVQEVIHLSTSFLNTTKKLGIAAVIFLKCTMHT